MGSTQSCQFKSLLRDEDRIEEIRDRAASSQTVGRFEPNVALPLMMHFLCNIRLLWI